jgi:excisionase family DNA binding protein
MLNAISSTHDSEWFDVADAAHALRVSGPTVRRLVAAKEITHHRVGHQIRIRREDLDAYLERTRVNAVS